MPKELCEAVSRGTVMWGKVLDMVATHPDYQRQGAASMLVQRGCDLADVKGSGTYVSASKNGASRYAKFGFVDYSNAGQETTVIVRRGQSQVFSNSQKYCIEKSSC
ncbi:Acyl-CoA N-acyltransferase [Penicillium camemberti]|uniref:Acyl-CoA N-acyltransferase n=1 Tax=Penicillium camemberti (strain FM 013) TaxID=1429867 RepID=A0A0G4P1Q1_PENC3|nr:Acyl-CoA N-acyltransferase [Penicillium camemberti]